MRLCEKEIRYPYNFFHDAYHADGSDLSHSRASKLDGELHHGSGEMRVSANLISVLKREKSSHLYMRSCPSIGRSISPPSVGQSPRKSLEQSNINIAECA